MLIDFLDHFPQSVLKQSLLWPGTPQFNYTAQLSDTRDKEEKHTFEIICIVFWCTHKVTLKVHLLPDSEVSFLKWYPKSTHYCHPSFTVSKNACVSPTWPLKYEIIKEKKDRHAKLHGGKAKRTTTLHRELETSSEIWEQEKRLSPGMNTPVVFSVTNSLVNKQTFSTRWTEYVILGSQKRSISMWYQLMQTEAMNWRLEGKGT